MRTLLIMRHGKSDWDVPGLRDIDRPLNKRGREASARIGGYIASESLEPDLILCSPAVRARQTLHLAMEQFTSSPEVRVVDNIYGADAPELRRDIRGHGGDVPILMVVGHNPTFHSLALALAGGGDADAMALLGTKFPTAGLAVIDFDFSFWRDIDPGSGRLRQFTVPRSLAQ